MWDGYLEPEHANQVMLDYIGGGQGSSAHQRLRLRGDDRAAGRDSTAKDDRIYAYRESRKANFEVPDLYTKWPKQTTTCVREAQRV